VVQAGSTGAMVLAFCSLAATAISILGIPLPSLHVVVPNKSLMRTRL
jgi:hypothetical protein